MLCVYSLLDHPRVWPDTRLVNDHGFTKIRSLGIHFNLPICMQCVVHYQCIICTTTTFMHFAAYYICNTKICRARSAHWKTGPVNMHYQCIICTSSAICMRHALLHLQCTMCQDLDILKYYNFTSDIAIAILHAGRDRQSSTWACLYKSVS